MSVPEKIRNPISQWISSMYACIIHNALEIIKKRRIKDPFLITAIGIGILFAVPGFTWGEYDCLNLDRMAFRGLFSESRRPFEPSSYVKPPFYTYLNYFIAIQPAKFIRNLYFWGEKESQGELFLRLRTSLARCVNIIFFALCTVAIFILANAFYSLFTARIASILFASSSGFIPYQIFLTTDLAVIFIMLASFLFAVKLLRTPSISYSVIAGLLAGLAFSTKYNGLAVAIALPVAHLLAGSNGNLLLKALKRKSAWICGACVPLGIVIGNPYMLIDWEKFKSDFVYNYTVTPVYSGAASGNGYSKFFESFFEIFGIPGSWLILVTVIIGIYWMLINLCSNNSWKLWIMAASVFALYTYKIGAFPRIETRFVLPAAPFVLMLAFAGFESLKRFKLTLIPALTIVVIFNLLCGFYTSRLFAEDPRNVAINYYKEHLTDGYVMEYSESLPKPEALKSKGKCFKMQMGLERVNNFETLFQGNTEMLSIIKVKENLISPEWFSMNERKKRGTDFVIWSSIDVEGIIQPHYDTLFNDSNTYKIIYDKSSPKVPDWVYPRYTEFLRNRTTIWLENWKPKPSTALN